MEFKELLKHAKAYDKRAMMDIIEMYRPLLISKSVVNGKFDEDLYQEFVYTMLMCILKFPYPQSKPEEQEIKYYMLCFGIDTNYILLYDKIGTSIFQKMISERRVFVSAQVGTKIQAVYCV